MLKDSTSFLPPLHVQVQGVESKVENVAGLIYLSWDLQVCMKWLSVPSVVSVCTSQCSESGKRTSSFSPAFEGLRKCAS